MAFTFPSIADSGLEPAADVFTRGFADYFVKIAASPALFLHMTRVDGVDLGLSPIIVRDGQAVGAALIARRGWTSRVAGMAIVPEARRAGAGRAVMAHLLEAARRRGDRAMVLEVIEQNEPALKLYEACGFERVRRLVGFARTAEAMASVSPGAGAPAVTEVDLRAVAARIAQHGVSDLPWQIAAETIAQLTPPSVGYQSPDAWVALSGLPTAQVTIRALVAATPLTMAEPGAALLRAMIAKHPGKEWRISAVWPEEHAEVFTAAGFTKSALAQWQMQRSLAGS